jgi:AcrR family transcriptional regulator
MSSQSHPPASAPEHDGYHHGDLAAACVEAGVALVEAGGPDALTIRGVARVVGVSHTAPLHHFPDRAALVAAVAERGFQILLERLEKEIGPDAGPRERLHAYGVAYVVHAAAHPGLFSLMFGPTPHPAGEGAYLLLIELCAETQAAGELPGDDPYRLALLLWSVVHGLAGLFVAGHIAAGSISGQPSDARFAATRTLDDLIAALITSKGANE